MLKLVLEKAEESEIKLATPAVSLKKLESSRKTSISALLTMPKPLTTWITTNCGKFLRRWKYQTTWPGSWEICMLVKKQQLEPDMEQQTGSKLGKEYIKAVYRHPDFLTYMQISDLHFWVWLLINSGGIRPRVCRLSHGSILRLAKCWTGWSTSWNQDCQEKYQ